MHPVLFRLDGGAHFYNTYETKDGRWLAVGALEPQFYEDLLQGLGLQDIPQYPDNFEESIRIFTEKFKEKSLEEWIKARLVELSYRIIKLLLGKIPFANLRALTQPYVFANPIDKKTYKAGRLW